MARKDFAEFYQCLALGHEDRKTNRQTDGLTDRQTDRRTERLTDGQADRQLADRGQADKQMMG